MLSQIVIYSSIGVVILLVIIMLSCYSPGWFELWVYGKTLMIDYDEDLVSLRISIFTSSCDKLLLSHDITLEYAL